MFIIEKEIQSGWRFGFLIAGLLLGAANRIEAQSFEYTQVQHPDSADTMVHGVNSQGWVVGEHGTISPNSPFDPGVRGFMFDGESFTDVFVPGSLQTSALAISDSGIVVGSYVNSAGRTVGFVYDGQSYETIVTPFAESASVTGINDAGELVGTISNDDFVNDVRSFRKLGDDYAELGYPGASQTFSGGLNDQGHMVGTGFDDIESFAFATNDYLPISGVDTLAIDGRGINDRGVIVGNYSLILGAIGFNLEIQPVGYLYDQTTETLTEFEFPTPACTYLLDAFDPQLPDDCDKTVRDINDHGVVVGHELDERGFVGFVAYPTDRVLGDFDEDGELLAHDLDRLADAMVDGTPDDSLDLNADGNVDIADREVWVEVLKHSWFGDANLDGEFRSDDLVLALAAGEYEDNSPGNSTWETGDWNGDRDFDTTDFVVAFSGGGYEVGPRAAPVPEPTAGLGLTGVAVVLGAHWRRRNAAAKA